MRRKRSAGDERGFFLLPVVMLLAITLPAAFLLIPSFDREDVIEAGRLRQDQARAAAEGAAELALARGTDVAEVRIGRAVAAARLFDDGHVEATAEVPGPRDAVVRVTIRVSR